LFFNKLNNVAISIFKRNSSFVLFLFLLFNSTIYSNEQSEIENRIEKLKFVEKNALNDSIGQIISYLFIRVDGQKSKVFLEKMLKVVQPLDIRAYLKVYTQFALYCPEKEIEMRLRALSIATKNQLQPEMGYILENISYYYFKKEQYDSAMINILLARDIYEELGDEVALVTVLHTIGDLYYHSNLFSEAETVYKEVQRRKGDPAAWSEWRNITILNDLGLIELKRRNFQEALKYFLNTLKSKERKINDTRNLIALSYIQRQIAETYYLMGNFDKALTHYNSGANYASECNSKEDLLALYIIKGNILLKTSQPDSALKYANLCSGMINNANVSLETSMNLNKLFVDVYEYKRNFREANFYLKRYNTIKDSLNTRTEKSKAMHILAKNEYERVQNKLLTANKEIRFYLSGAAIMLILCVIIAVSYFQLKRKNRFLVKKSMEANRNFQNKTIVADLSESNPPASSNDGNLQSLILFRQFEEVMKTNKYYLEKNLTIQTTAKYLDTNRTYLSAAINFATQNSFTAYINSLRILEAIKLITEGKAKNFTIEGLALSVGFNNRASFISAFKSQTGVSPSFFIKNLNKVNNSYPEND